MALDILNEKFLTWVSKNRGTFLLAVLLTAVAYQYMDNKKSAGQYEETIKGLNDKIQQMSKESLEYERNRSERLEILLNSLPKNQDDGKPHSNR